MSMQGLITIVRVFTKP